MYLQCICSFKNILFSICVTSQTSPLSPVSPLTAWSENRGKVNLQSGSACETGLAQKNRAQSFSAQVQQCFPNLTFSALAFWCCSSGRHTVWMQLRIMYTKLSGLCSRRKYCIMGCHRWFKAKPWSGYVSAIPSLQTASSLCNLGLTQTRIWSTNSLYHTPSPSQKLSQLLWYPWNSPVEKLKVMTRSVLDNVVLITSLVRPYWEGPATSWKEGGWDSNWRGWLTRRCCQFLLHGNHWHQSVYEWYCSISTVVQ